MKLLCLPRKNTDNRMIYSNNVASASKCCSPTACEDSGVSTDSGNTPSTARRVLEFHAEKPAQDEVVIIVRAVC